MSPHWHALVFIFLPPGPVCTADIKQHIDLEAKKKKKASMNVDRYYKFMSWVNIICSCLPLQDFLPPSLALDDEFPGEFVPFDRPTDLPIGRSAVGCRIK